MLSKLLLAKLLKSIFLGLIGIAFGYMAGGVFEGMGIYTDVLPWQEFVTFLGGIVGILMGFSDSDPTEE